MKILFNLILSIFLTVGLPMHDIMARGFGGGGRGGGGGGGRSFGGGGGGGRVSKPVSRPSHSRPKTSHRSPMTGSRPSSRPSKPASRPSVPKSRPSTPSARPSIPQSRPSKPNTRPSVPKSKPSAPAPRPSGPKSKPSTRPSKPSTKPALPTTRPAPSPSRPSTKPGNVTFPKPDRPSTRPSNPGGGNRPTLPGGGDRPSTLPARPNPGGGNRPTLPGGGDRPSTLPARPPGNGGGIGDRPGNRPGQLPSRPDFGNRPGNGDRPGIGDRPGSGSGNWWDNNRPNRPGGGNVNIGSGNNISINRNTNINNNFKNSINWSTNRKNWGYNPWWNRPANNRWYGGSWNCGWRRPPLYYPPRWPGYYTGPSAAAIVGWGLVGWGLGNLIFDCGYTSYYNPYPVEPIIINAGPPVTYSQPITVVAAETVPATEEVATAQATKSELLMDQSLESFKANDYLTALEAVNKAIAESPGDGAFHEYRALVLFALGQYGEAAGVLNPLLVSSPGWDWSTMVQLYGNADTYTEQLRKLEEYAKSNSESAPAQFLLGYHYMVCTYLDEAADAFAKAA